MFVIGIKICDNFLYTTIHLRIAHTDLSNAEQRIFCLLSRRCPQIACDAAELLDVSKKYRSGSDHKPKVGFALQIANMSVYPHHTAWRKVIVTGHWIRLL